MKRMQSLLTVVVLVGAVFPAQAQLFRSRPQRLNMQVPELIVTARTDNDERRKIAAIEQLRESDTKAYPDIAPSLVEIMLHDASSSVRMEAMHSLVKMRPMTQQVGQALQQTASQDANWRVRMQTKTQIFLNGYHAGNGTNQNAPMAPTTNEPPLGTAIGQPIYMPGPGSPAAGTPGTMARPLPSRPPVYNTVSPQTPVEMPAGGQPVQGQPYVPAPPQQIPAQRSGSFPQPLPQVPAQPPLPLPPPAGQPIAAPQTPPPGPSVPMPPAPPAQPLPQVPAPPPVQPLPQIPVPPPAPPVAQSAPAVEPVDAPILPPTE